MASRPIKYRAISKSSEVKNSLEDCKLARCDWLGESEGRRLRSLSLCNPQTCLQAAGRALIPCSGPLALTSVLTGKLSSDCWQDYSPDKDRGHSERTNTY